MNIDNMSFKDMLALRVLLSNKISAVEKAAEDSIKQGIPVAGFNMQVGRNMRKVNNEIALVQSLDGILAYSEMYTAKIIGLPAMEKALKAKQLTKGEIAAMLEPYIDTVVTPSKLVFIGNEETTTNG